MKFLIPLAVIAGLVGAIVTFQKFFPSPTAKEQSKSPHELEQSSSSQSVDKKEPKTQIQFMYKDSNPILSKKDSPYTSPDGDYKPNRASSEGYVVQAKDGIALIQTDTDKALYVITDTGQDNHKTAVLYGYTKNPAIIYADTEESYEQDPYSGLDGIFTGKTISYGYVIQANPNKCIIKRIDGGKTYITFTRPTGNRNKAEGKEQTQTPLIENISAPEKVDKQEKGIYSPSPRD